MTNISTVRSADAPAGAFGLVHTGVSLEQVQEALAISDGRAKKLRDLHLLRPTPNSGKGKRERFNGFDLEFLAAARSRPLPVTAPTLICSIGVEKNTKGHDLRPSMFFDRNEDMSFDSDEESGSNKLKRVVQALENASTDTLHSLGDLTADDVVAGIRARRYFVTGFWKVTDTDSYALVGGIALASYTGFILDGGRVICEVPKTVQSRSGGRCFVVEPFSGSEQSTYCHNYREPKVGPSVEFILP